MVFNWVVCNWLYFWLYFRLNKCVLCFKSHVWVVRVGVGGPGSAPPLDYWLCSSDHLPSSACAHTCSSLSPVLSSHTVCCAPSPSSLLSLCLSEFFYFLTHCLYFFSPQIHPLVIQPSRRWVEVRSWNKSSWAQMTRITRAALTDGSESIKICFLHTSCLLIVMTSRLLDRCCIYSSESISYIQRCRSAQLVTLYTSAAGTQTRVFTCRDFHWYSHVAEDVSLTQCTSHRLVSSIVHKFQVL